MTTQSNPHTALAPLPAPLAELAAGVELLDPMEAPAIRWGILGAGGIAAVFAHDVAAYSSGVMAGIAARDPKRAQEFAATYNVEKAYDSYEDLVAADDIDAVYVATVHPHHEKLATLALNAGKPVLVEKCFTMDAVSAKRVLDLAKEKDLFCMEAMWTRHLPHQKVLSQIVANGGLGAVSTVHADHGQKLEHIRRMWDPELGGGALMDLGVYSMSFVHQILPDVKLVGATANLTDLGVDVQSAALLKTDTAVAMAASNFNGRSATYGEVVFERGAVEMEEQFYRPSTLRLRTFGEGKRENGETVEWSGIVPGGFQYQAAEVARCLTAGTKESDTMPRSATLRVMELLDEMRAQTNIVYPWEK